MSSSSTSRKITLKSFDGEFFEVDEVVARESQTINVMIDDGVADKIPIPNVKGETLAKIIEYCEKHVEAATANSDEEPAKKDLTSWDEEFIRQLDLALFFDLIRSSHYLNIKDLMDLTYCTVADMIIGKTPEEIREKFHIKNDFTPEEEAQIKRENQWAFE